MAYIAGELIDADHPLAVSLSGGGSVLLGGDVVDADHPLTTLVADVSIATTDLRDASVASPNDGEVMTFVTADAQWQSKPLPASIAGPGGTVDAADATGVVATAASGKVVTLAAGGGTLKVLAGGNVVAAIPSNTAQRNVLDLNAAGSGRLKFTQAEAEATNGQVLLTGINNASLLLTDTDEVQLVWGGNGDAIIHGNAAGDLGVNPSAGAKLAFFADAGGGATKPTIVDNAASIGDALVALGLVTDGR